MEETLESRRKGRGLSQYLEMLDMIGDWLKGIGLNLNLCAAVRWTAVRS